MNSKFSISVKDIRAIKEAEVELNGITVLSGVNGCGKTTIAKLLFGFIKTSLNFDTVISDLYTDELSFAASFLRDFVPTDKNKFLEEDTIDYYTVGANLPRILQKMTAEKYISDVIIPRIKMICQKYKEEEFTITKTAYTRLSRLYKEHVRKIEATTAIELLTDYESYLLDIVNEISNLNINHDLKVYNNQFAKYFNENPDKWNYTFKEFDSNLIDKRNKSVTLQKSFSDVLYVDVPTLFDSDVFRRELVHSDLLMALRKERELKENTSISKIFEDTIQGKISRKEDMFSRIFMYTAKNGQSIPLSQAASGLKCFAVLERLYANGYLKEDSLLIVDEPEVHLHPKWIVEYARVLVYIQKYLHTTILIASHNPDMISAIKYISEKEKVADSLTFYIADEVESEGFGKYKFKNLGTDIEEIFSSFNIALDRISQYGALEDE